MIWVSDSLRCQMLDVLHEPPALIPPLQRSFHLRHRIRRLNQLFVVCQFITSEMNLHTLFEVIMEQTNQIMGTQRNTAFLYDRKCQELWSLVATGMKKKEIRIPSDYGVAGWVSHHNTPLIINDAYSDPRFYSGVDTLSGFRIKNFLCVPLINREGHCIGTLQALNKIGYDFKDEDIEWLTSISQYVIIAFENSMIFEELKGYSEELETTPVRLKILEKVKGQNLFPPQIRFLPLHQQKLLSFRSVWINSIERCQKISPCFTKSY
jgi:signal transduction protein with GAF and PtsI domain